VLTSARRRRNCLERLAFHERLLPRQGRFTVSGWRRRPAEVGDSSGFMPGMQLALVGVVRLPSAAQRLDLGDRLREQPVSLLAQVKRRYPCLGSRTTAAAGAS
jgi:hypothetical protein